MSNLLCAYGMIAGLTAAWRGIASLFACCGTRQEEGPKSGNEITNYPGWIRHGHTGDLKSPGKTVNVLEQCFGPSGGARDGSLMELSHGVMGRAGGADRGRQAAHERWDSVVMGIPSLGEFRGVAGEGRERDDVSEGNALGAASAASQRARAGA